MSNEAIIKELRNLNKVIDEIMESQLTGIPFNLMTTPPEALPTQLRVFAYDYAMENGALSSALRLAADTIETLLAERNQ
jgi:predicted component of type VI protein secretion system